MIKNNIVGHRGAAGLALENTMPSFQAARQVGARIIELDVHTTADGAFVVAHDKKLSRISTNSSRIKNLTLKELQNITLNNGSHVPTLSEVLDFARRHQIALIVEIKAVSDLEAFCNLLDNYTDVDVTVASFQHKLVGKLRKLRPNLKLFLIEAFRPINVVLKARDMKTQGIDLNFALMNPLTYLLARRFGLQIMLYTINSRLVSRIIRYLYPGVWICTNYPNRLITSDD